MSKQKIPMQLPFAAGQAWRVTQGNNGSISHMDVSKYSFDFALNEGQTKGQPIYACAAGEVVDVRKGYFYVKHAESEYCVYMHCITESVNVKVGDKIQMGQQIAQAGDETGDPSKKVGAHLHVALSNVVGLPAEEDGGKSGAIFQTLPVEFMDYEVKQPNDTWKFIPSGTPQQDGIVKRVSRWSAWIPQGGKFADWSHPGVISRQPTITDIFMRGMDNRLWQKSYVSGANPPWSGWMAHNDGFELHSDPAVDSMGPNHLHLFAVGKDNQLWQKWCTNGKTWSAWIPQGGKFADWSHPGVISRQPTITDIFMRGMDNRLWQKSYVSGANPPWSGWMAHNDGFELHSDPAVDSMGPNHLHLFAVGKDNQLWQKWCTNGKTWSAWISQGGKFADWSHPGVISRQPTITDIFMRGMDNRLWQKSYVSGANPPWSGWMAHNDGFELHSDPAVDSMGPNHLHLFAVGKDNQLWQKWWVE